LGNELRAVRLQLQRRDREFREMTGREGSRGRRWRGVSGGGL